jgi:hypothetical protein
LYRKRCFDHGVEMGDSGTPSGAGGRAAVGAVSAGGRGAGTNVSDTAATKNLRIERNKETLRIQRLVIILCPKNMVNDRDSWWPIHGCELDGVPRGAFRGLFALFQEILVGGITDVNLWKNALHALIGKELGAMSRKGQDKTQRWFASPRRTRLRDGSLSASAIDFVPLVMPYNQKHFHLDIPFRSVLFASKKLLKRFTFALGGGGVGGRGAGHP